MVDKHKKSNIKTLIDKLDNQALNKHPDTTLYKLFDSIGAEFDRLDSDLQEVLDQKYVQNATGKELDKLGKFAGIERKGDTDKVFRLRIKIQFREVNSEGTYNELMDIASLVFDTSVDNINPTWDRNRDAVGVILNVDQDIVTASPFSDKEIVETLNRSVPASHRVYVQTLGQFRVKSSDTYLGKSHGFADEGYVLDKRIYSPRFLLPDVEATNLSNFDVSEFKEGNLSEDISDKATLTGKTTS